MRIPVLLQIKIEIFNSNIDDAIKEFPTLRMYLQEFKRTRSGMFISKAEVLRDKEDTVLKTEPAAGEKSKLGSPVKIYIPKVEYKYPDFTKGYTIAKIEEFVSKHELKLEIKYQETTSAAEGTILKQSRAASSLVTPGASLVITIARAPEAEEPTTGPTTVPTEGDNTGE